MPVLGSFDSWQTILSAARIQNYPRVLQLSEQVPSGGFPCMKFHKQCRSMFTMKRDLNKIQQERDSLSSQQESSPSDCRKSTRNSSECKCKTVLPKQCIFCNKVKYLKNTRTEKNCYPAVRSRLPKQQDKQITYEMMLQ